MSDNDPFSGLGYRRLIPWRQRIGREWPFLSSVLDTAPERSVLDIGCGTGEHALYMAQAGFRVVGIDRSESQIAAARDHEGTYGDNGPHFVLGDVRDLPQLAAERFGAALCVGNTLPSLEDDDLRDAAAAIRSRLVPGAPWVIQILNYERILKRNVRSLPVTVRDGERPGEEIVFLRLMTADPPHHVVFHPSVLHLRRGAEPALTVAQTKEVRLRAWTRDDLESVLAAAGFEIKAVYGSMTGGQFKSDDSTDLVMVVRAT